jgi:FkbM family methyltransferase
MLTIGRSRIDARILERFEVRELGVSVDGFDSPIFIRPSHTDFAVFGKIFFRDEYRPKQTLGDVKTIIDAGANVGYSSLWFSREYPQARIFAIEPDPVNFVQLSRNCGHVKNIHLINSALWGEKQILSLQFEHKSKYLGSWGTRTIPQKLAANTVNIQVQAISIDDIMKEYNLEYLDYVKMDIEGAEYEVFDSSNTKWLSRTQLLVAEFHDAFRPGVSAVAEKALSPYVVNSYAIGENRFFELKDGRP